jgi:predicted MFS family arabinose efflux permease
VNRPEKRIVLVATSGSTIGSIPVFLLGATALFVRGDLGFTQAELGVAVSAFWFTMAAGGVYGGRLGQRMGAARSVRIGVTASCVALLLAAASPSLAALVAAMALAGLANALTQPSVDLAVFNAVEPRNLGLAFGIKQTALPGAALFAGLGVPIIAQTVGWRATFVAGALVALPALLLMPSKGQGPAPRPAGARGHAPLVGIWWFALSFLLAMVAVSATGAFYVESAVAGGTAVETAGLLLAVGSAFGIVGRFVFAWRLTSAAEPLRAAGLIMIFGGAALAAFAFAPTGAALLLTTVVALGAGWGWNGLLTLAVVGSYPGHAARASGYIVLGAGAGGILGPLSFGLVAQHVGFARAWLLSASSMTLAAILLVALSARRSRSGRPEGEDSDDSGSAAVSPTPPARPDGS